MIEVKALRSSSKGNCYHITDGTTSLLIECGIKLNEIQKGIGFKLSEVQGCLISHEHKDHSLAVNELLKRGINCYTSSGTIEELDVDHHRLLPVKSKLPFKIGTWSIVPFDVQHDVSEPFGFLLVNKAGDKLLFATDTYYIKYRFFGLTHIMIEANYSKEILDRKIEQGHVPALMKDRLMRSHFSLENVKDFFKVNDMSKVQEIWLLHLSDSNSDASAFKREIAQITGKVIHVP
ncbi:MBL fold metallo-hydrolase [Alkalicoccobacillus plakortidis]|uniref:MBL fold metallo-hydrolase n=1 Tax=Alkalicoccobacillus plakortidis TaxID=444060 RepID=A0ABT0XK40_9BACI|nr:MBL fold metallo-hydrolase [Alkalicoccobacillus plakortidis]MCM2675599.1 MBL fold metallo-hydrolase [Alkalicoccobacillus plakortidis]